MCSGFQLGASSAVTCARELRTSDNWNYKEVEFPFHFIVIIIIIFLRYKHEDKCKHMYIQVHGCVSVYITDETLLYVCLTYSKFNEYRYVLSVDKGKQTGVILY